MALKHDFFLVSERELSNGKWLYLKNQKQILNKNKLRVDDELIRYIADTISWIPTFNPDKKEHITGLCYWGNTIIDKSGAEKLSEVLKGWINIFSTANDNIELKGAFITDEEKAYGEYEMIVYNKKSLIETLTLLLNLSKRVIKEEKILLHMGI